MKTSSNPINQLDGPDDLNGTYEDLPEFPIDSDETEVDGLKGDTAASNIVGIQMNLASQFEGVAMCEVSSDLYDQMASTNLPDALKTPLVPNLTMPAPDVPPVDFLANPSVTIEPGEFEDNLPTVIDPPHIDNSLFQHCQSGMILDLEKRSDEGQCSFFPEACGQIHSSLVAGGQCEEQDDDSELRRKLLHLAEIDIPENPDEEQS